MKRLFDMALSLVGLIVLSPLLLAIAAWIKLDSPGPVFYRGKRAGRGGKPFYVFKFRSMVTDAERCGGPTTPGDDPRVTRSGRVIRRFKLDEFPQLINVLLGQMSLVGPRPQVVDWEKDYAKQRTAILAMRPGITDWASIWNSDEGGVLAGVPDPDAAYEKVLHPRKLELQRLYCDTCNLLVDVKIILYTLVRICRKNWLPPELKHYPTLEELKQEVAAWQAQQVPEGAHGDAPVHLCENSRADDVFSPVVLGRELANSAR